MAKVALLIGVSDYGDGLASLPGTQTDIQEMQRVLQNPKVSGFDAIGLLSNPDPFEMQLAIEKLFSENRSRDNLILLYFSGHGVRDDNGTLYFATRVTQKNQQGRIFTSTAVSSSFIQTCMSQSRSKRQVLILDCCFSGAFANDMKAKQAVDGAIDIKAQLGGEGRAVLTSSTATQVSYEREGTSIYTRYLVQGLETGAADRDSNGHITIDELHEYAKEKVQEAAPTMQPEIYAVREGYKILIAQAPQDDPKLIYRKELDERAKLKRGNLSPIDHRAFNYRRRELGLSAQEAEQITDEVLQPYQEFWGKLNEFDQAVKEMLDYDPQMSFASLDDLRYLQQVLRLRDKDTTPILKANNIETRSVPPSWIIWRGSTDEETNQPLDDALDALFSSPISQPKLEDSLNVNRDKQDKLLVPLLTSSNLEQSPSSERNIDYTRLRDLLKAGDWKEADQETYRIMIQAVDKKDGDGFTKDELLNFPCVDLRTIDRLWVRHSNGKFGFSVQNKIYLECGGIPDGQYYKEVFKKFGGVVGWRQNGSWRFDMIWNTSAPKGHLPLAGGWGYWLGDSDWNFIKGVVGFSSLFSHIETCKLTT